MKYLMIRLPFRLMYYPRGKRIFTQETSRVKDLLDISDDCAAPVGEGIFALPITPFAIPKNRIDYPVLADEYQQLLSNGACKDLADIARHFDVSRVWVTNVLN
jgi:hypothetical protein